MTEVLANPSAGYYTNREEVFGTAGDFITSPEISQMFGEMIGIWAVAFWHQVGCPPSLRLVEFGPGRGTLMADLLRGTAAFPDFTAALSVDMVEISPVLRLKQQQKLLGGKHDNTAVGSSSTQSIATPTGVTMQWHRDLEEVPEAWDGPTVYIAHEFFDALPVHQFQRAGRTWRERLVDEAPPNDPRHFRLVLSPGPTAAVRALLPRRLESIPLRRRAGMNSIEICPKGMALAETLAKRVAHHGGAALIIDYGRDGPFEDSVRAIRTHRLSGPFESPGSADLSAWVDFEALRLAVKHSGASAVTHGPISQARFLQGLGMETRLHQLLQGADDAQEVALIAGYQRLVGGTRIKEETSASPAGKAPPSTGSQQDSMEYEGMGENYQAMCITPSGIDVPLPFS